MEIPETEFRYNCSICGAQTKSKEPDVPKICTGCNSKNSYKLISFIEIPKDHLKIITNECHESIISIIRKFLDLKECYYPLLATWIIGTYIFKEFSAFPYIFINAAKGSGKTRLLKLCSSLAWEGSLETSINETNLFRTSGSLFFDECENIAGKEKQNMRLILNAAYKKGITIKRAEKVKDKSGESYVLKSYEPYRPIMLANIWGIEEVLADRAITLILEKSDKKGITKIIEDFEENEQIKQVKRTLHLIQCSLCSVVTSKTYIKKWNNYIMHRYYNYTTTLTTNTTNTTLTTTPTTFNIEDSFLEEIFLRIDNEDIDSRNLELFFPFFIISNFLSEELFANILLTSKEIVKTKKTDELTESRDVSLIDFISLQNNMRFGRIIVADLTKQFREFLGDTDEDDRWLNPKWVGRALKRLNLTIGQNTRVAKGVQVQLNVDKAKEKLKIFKTPEDKPNEQS